MTANDPSRFLPLQAHDFQILISLLDDDLHGYLIIQDISRRTGGETVLGTSTLYAAIKRMVRTGLLREVPRPADADSDDTRRRYYRTTGLGRQVAHAEARRIRRLDRMGVAAGLLDGPAPGETT